MSRSPAPSRMPLVEEPRRRGHLRRWALTASLSLALAGCSSDGGAAPGSAASPPGFGHVHGLGIDPSDGALYAATHYGLFLVPYDGPPERVGDRLQDTMGFAVTGPGTFLGSGHPDFAADPDLPARLGLIRSGDAGLTWTSVSLLGEADLHALRSVGEVIFGWDSGTGSLLVSPDAGRTWEARSVLALRDFVVDPGDAERLLATTEQGLQQSRDGGRTWAPVPGAPALLLLSWPATERLVGAAPDGTVSTSTDGGATWVRAGSTSGAPAALTSGTEPELIAVATEGGVQVSTDGGVSFGPSGRS